MTALQLVFTVAPALVLLIAGAVAVRVRFGPATRSAVLHLAAGVVFAVVAVELIPHLLRDHRPMPTIVGFAAGVAAMLGLRAVSNRAARDAPRTGLSAGLVGGVAVDLALDGILLGVGFAAGEKEGRMLAAALALELVSLGIALASTMTRREVPRRRALGVLLALAATFLAGAVAGLLLLSQVAPPWLDGTLAFGCAALLFLVTEELLTEAHEARETPALTALFFAGFLAFLVAGLLA